MSGASATLTALRRIGWLLVTIASALVFAYGALRFANEIGVSPLRYVIEDALFAIVGVLGILAGVARFRKAVADSRASDLAELEAATTARLAYGVTRFEARLGLGRIALNGFLGLLMLGLGVLMGVAGWRQPSVPIVVAFGSPLFFVLALVLLYSTLRQLPSMRPSLVLDGSGLDHVFRGVVRWSDVIGISLKRLDLPRGGKLPMLMLGPRPGASAQGGIRGWPSKRKDLLEIPLQGLEPSPERILAASLELRDRVAPPRPLAWSESLSAEFVHALQEQERLLSEMDRIDNDAQHLPEAAEAAMELLAPEFAANAAVLRREVEIAVGRTRTRAGWLIGVSVLFLVLALIAVAAKIG